MPRTMWLSSRAAILFWSVFLVVDLARQRLDIAPTARVVSGFSSSSIVAFLPPQKDSPTRRRGIGSPKNSPTANSGEIERSPPSGNLFLSSILTDNHDTEHVNSFDDGDLPTHCSSYRNGTNTAPPFSDTLALNTELKNLSQSDEFGSAKRAQSLLEAAEAWYANRTASGLVSVYPTQEALDNALVLLRKKNKHPHEGILVAKERRIVGPVPDTRSYTSVIDAWARMGAASEAQIILQRMDELAIPPTIHDTLDDIPSRGVSRPTTMTYNAVINAWSKQKRRSSSSEDRTNHPLRAEALLSQMQQHYQSGINTDCKPDSITYNTVMKVWANSGRSDAGSRAEHLLERMWIEYRTDNNMFDENLKPNQFSYATAISAWARCGGMGANAARRGELLLEQMEESHKNGDVTLRPTTCCVNAVLNAWAKSKEKGSARRAEVILRRMEALYMDGFRSELQPDTISYNTVISAYARSGEYGAERRAECILRRMDDLSSNDMTRKDFYNCRPDNVSYNTVIHCWARSKEPGAARRAEAILRHMERRWHNAGDGGTVCPDVTTYTTVVHAWAKSSHKHEPNAAERAELVLKRMEEAATTQQEQSCKAVRPNVLTYNAVCNAWAKSQNPRAPDRAMALLQKMNESGMKPDIVTYTSVMDALANHGSGSSNGENANRAMDLLNEVETIYETTGDGTMKPNVRTYTSVIHAISRSKLHPIHAEEILHRMERFVEINDSDSVEYNKTSIKPDVVCFNAIINAWGWSDESGKAKRTYDLFLRMKDLYTSGINGHAKPDLITCNSILNACAFSSKKEDRREAMDVAVKTLEEVQQFAPLYGRPNHNTYGMMLMTIHNLMASDEEFLRENMAKSVFWQCCNDGQVSAFVLQQLQKTVSPNVLFELLGEKVAGPEDGTIQVTTHRLPYEWTFHAVVGGGKKKNRPSKKQERTNVSKHQQQ